jgi:holo-[acyl-carrier protein] synthase
VQHLAGKWAAKEAFIKAWGSAISPKPPPIPPDAVDFAEIEVVKDLFGRPGLKLHGKVANSFSGEANNIAISISHDGNYAVAVCNLR